MDRGRQELQPAYVLHSYPFRETSLVVEVFSRDFGRLGMVARGARRPRSPLRGLLQAFQPLRLSWHGKSELRTLTGAEWQGGLPNLSGLTALCGLYMNELLLRLLPRDDAHQTLYTCYHGTLLALAGPEEHSALLRSFEKTLLKELGYALLLEHDAETGAPIDAANSYYYALEQGPRLQYNGTEPWAPSAGIAVLGKTLLDMACDDYRDPLTQQQSKALMRRVITHYLGGRELHTRQLLRDIMKP
ncbi:MAG: DNA repair protein RecO [Burkholderiales bacterium]